MTRADMRLHGVPTTHYGFVPIMVPGHSRIPLRGYHVYLDDLDELVADASAPIDWWTADGQTRQARTRDQLVRREVAGFAIGVGGGRLVVNRRRKRGLWMGESVIETRDVEEAARLLSVLPRDRVAWPWRGHGCRFIPRTRAEHVVRWRWGIGVTVTVLLGALSLVVALSR